MKIRRWGMGATIAAAALTFLPSVQGTDRPTPQVAPPGQIVHDVKVTNIEVPVRVFKGNTFLDTLSKEDFEVLEDGVPQTVDGVYLVRKTSLARKEGGGPALPRTSRLFVLLFEMSDYQPEIARAMEYFFRNVIEAQDELILMTPMSTYSLKPGMFLKTSRAKVKDELLSRLKSGIMIGGSEYRGLLRELVTTMSGPGFLDQKLLIYGETMKRLENLRHVDEKKLIEFARFLKNREGQKHVFFFYQKEVVPKINPREISLLIEANQQRPDMMFDLMEKFEFYNRDVTFDVRAVQEAFSDSSIAVHFLYLTKARPPQIDLGVGIGTALKESTEEVTPESNFTVAPVADQPIAGGTSFLTFEEQSEDIFSAFSEIARATGGLIESGAAADMSLQRAAEANENYYLLYYQPKNAKADKSFRKIEVRVKGGGVRVTYRRGYVSG